MGGTMKKKHRLLSILLSCMLVVGMMPSFALAADNTTPQQRGGANTYTVDVTNSNYKVGVNGAEPAESRIGSTGIILNPGDKLVWTSTGGKKVRSSGMMDHHGDDNYPYEYSTGVGFKIIKSNANEQYELGSVCDVEQKEYQIVSGGITQFDDNGTITNYTDQLIYAKDESLPDGLKAATVNVDDSMTANVPMLVKATDGGQAGVYYTYCSIHTTCTWNAYYYGVGHTFTVEPLVNTAGGNATAGISVDLDSGAQGSGSYPQSITLGNDPVTLSLDAPIKSGSAFVGWEVVDENGDTRTFRGLFEEKEDGSLYYPGLNSTNWSAVRNSIGKTIHIKPIWTNFGALRIELDGNGGIVRLQNNSNKTYVTTTDNFYAGNIIRNWYDAVRPGYDFLGWSLNDQIIENVSDIPARYWDPNGVCTVKAKWERNSDTVCFELDSPTKKLTILDGSFFAFDEEYYGWEKGIEELDITKNITEIPERAFIGYDGLTSVVVPDSVTTIGYSAFVYMKSLKEVYVPGSVTTIGNVEPLFGYCQDDSVTVYCEEGSAIEQYAQKINDTPDKIYHPYIIHYAKYNNNGTIDLIHSWDAGTETKAATETEPGTKKYTCTKCTETKEEEIIGHKHTWNDGVVTAATASANGKSVTKCKVCGVVTATKVIPRISSIKLSVIQYTYSGTAKNPSLIVKDSTGKTIASTNYSVLKSDGRKNVGKYYYKITFKGNYSGTKYVYFDIVPKGTSIVGVTGAKKAFTVKWKKQSTKMATSTITGYQIRYSTSSKMTGAKTKTVKGYKYTSKKITNLKAKKKYYVQIRTYKTVSGKNYYSSWSSVKSVQTK